MLKHRLSLQQHDKMEALSNHWKRDLHTNTGLGSNRSFSIHHHLVAYYTGGGFGIFQPYPVKFKPFDVQVVITHGRVDCHVQAFSRGVIPGNQWLMQLLWAWICCCCCKCFCGGIWRSRRIWLRLTFIHCLTQCILWFHVSSIPTTTAKRVMNLPLSSGSLLQIRLLQVQNQRTPEMNQMGLFLWLSILLLPLKCLVLYHFP